MFDSHMHTLFSPDSKMEMENAIKTGIELGLEAITFTDHMDHGVVNETFTFDVDEYSNTINSFKEKYQDKIKLLIGIEEGYQDFVLDKIKHELLILKPDYILNSIHSLDGYDIAYPHFYKNETKNSACCKYLSAMYDSLFKMPDYDCVGHIGYIKRYMPYDDKTLKATDYFDYIHAILKKIINDGKGIEVNTSGLKSYGFLMPDIDILKMYKELGGEILTIGSDAHNEKAICQNFKETLDILLDLKFKYICYYENRKPNFKNILDIRF